MAPAQALVPLFELGQIVATPAALQAIESGGITPLELLQRHVAGDFGDLCVVDVAANFQAIERGLRILSRYAVAGEALYVITEADRTSTCILLVGEY